MKDTQKKPFIAFIATMVALACMLWMPIYLAGPDGLEQVMFDLTGNDEYEPVSDFNFEGSPFPDYEFMGFENTYVHTWVIGIIGALITLVITMGLFKLITAKKKGINENGVEIKN